MTPQEHFEAHFDDNRVITKECEHCGQDDILTTVNFTILDENGKDETLEENICNNCLDYLKNSKVILINGIR